MSSPATSLFPDEITSGAYRRRRRIRRTVTAAVVLVLLAGGGLAVAQTTGSKPTVYRLATASQQAVTATLEGVATIQPVVQADVAFPNSGTVTTVDVAVGDTVTTGQQLAQLDTADLLVTVRSKEAALDKAQLILAEAIDGKDVSSLVGGAAGRSFVLSPAAVTRALALLPADAPDGLAAARAGVAAAQHDVDSAISEAASALDSATSVCSAIGVDPDNTDPSAVSSAVNACQSALNTVVSKQDKVKGAQNDLADASSALDSLLQQWADDAATATTAEPATTAPAATTATTSPPTSPSTTSGSTSDTSTTTSTPSTGDDDAIVRRSEQHHRRPHRRRWLRPLLERRRARRAAPARAAVGRRRSPRRRRTSPATSRTSTPPSPRSTSPTSPSPRRRSPHRSTAP